MEPTLESIAEIFGFGNAPSSQQPRFAQVVSVSDDTLGVTLGNETVDAVRCCTAAVDDVVLLCFVGGRAIARRGGGGDSGGGGSYEEYDGSYYVVPSWNQQVLLTQGKVMPANVGVLEIHKSEATTLGTSGYTISV